MRSWFGAGIAAGIAIFIWGALSHMVFQIGDIGIKPLPQEAAVLTQLTASVKEPGVYFFPGAEAGNDMRKMADDWAKYPHGLMTFTPSDGQPFSLGPRLAVQLVLDIICGLIAAWLLWHALTSIASFAGKVVFVIVVGLAPVFAVNAPYWNWYGFSTTFFCGQLIECVVGFAVGGIVLAALMRRT